MCVYVWGGGGGCVEGEGEGREGKGRGLQMGPHPPKKSEGSPKLRQNQCQYCTSTMINMPSETTHFPDRNLTLQVGISLYFQM